MRSLLRIFSNQVDRLQWLPPLLARITVGLVFVESGWGKLHHIDKVTEFFTTLGIPAPAAQAYFVSASELVFGGLILIGLCTRLAAVPLAIIMIVAILTAKRDELNSVSDLVGFSEYLYLVLLIWLGIAGPGKISADRIFCRK